MSVARMKVGDFVVALEPIIEKNFGGRRVYMHARPGDLGRVLDVYADFTYFVGFKASSTDCLPASVRRASRAEASGLDTSQAKPKRRR